MLIEYFNVFTWSYRDMLAIDHEMAQHTIRRIQDMKHVKKELHRMKTDEALKFKEEVILQTYWIYNCWFD